MMVLSSTFFLGFCISIIYSAPALSTDSCIMNSFSIKQEQKVFADFVLKGKNMIFMNLIFNQSYSDEFTENKKLERWVWVANDYQYILSYPEDVDVFSFGLLKSKQDSLEVEINIGNLTEACKSHFNSYLAQHISKVVQRNSSVTDNVINTSEGYICHSQLEKDEVKEYISDISAVKLGFPFLCYSDNNINTTTVIKKSYVNYIVISIIVFTYCFYPLAMEMAFYIEDRKIRQGFYYFSESPYSPSVFCKRILFSGNNKYLATLRVILMVMGLTTLVYYIKSEVHDHCKCSLKSSNDNQSFQHAENIYISSPELVVWGALHFVLVNICVLVNSDGSLDDFIIFDFTNICNNGTLLKTVNVSIFLSNNDKQQNQNLIQNDQEQQQDNQDESHHQQQSKRTVSHKIRKIFLCLSYSFWSKIFFINSVGINQSANSNQPVSSNQPVGSNQSADKKPKILHKIVRLHSALCFPVNFILVLGSTFCPVVFTVYVLFTKYINVVIGNLFHKNLDCCKGDKNKVIDFILQSVSHTITITYLILTYKYAFNIFFYGISYVIQFFIFTLFLAVPHFSIQSYIYIIFFTSVVIYISRFVFQFIDLYKSLLEKILEMQDETSIQIEHFDEVVAKHFPLSNEIFYLLVKIILSCSFFAIIYDTMSTVGYIKFGAQPDLTTIISLIFLFGPPRLVEALLMTDFTSRVHMKEKEIKEELKKLRPKSNTKDNKTIEKTCSVVFTDAENGLPCVAYLMNLWKRVKPDDSKNVPTNNTKLHLEKCCEYNPKCFWLRWLCMFCCGCCNCPFDDKGYCEYCAIMDTGFNSEDDNIKLTMLKIPCVCIEHDETIAKKLKNPEDKDIEGTKIKKHFESENKDGGNTEAKKQIQTERKDEAKSRTKVHFKTEDKDGGNTEAKEPIKPEDKDKGNTEAEEPFKPKDGEETKAKLTLELESKDGENTEVEKLIKNERKDVVESKTQVFVENEDKNKGNTEAIESCKPEDKDEEEIKAKKDSETEDNVGGNTEAEDSFKTDDRDREETKSKITFELTDKDGVESEAEELFENEDNDNKNSIELSDIDPSITSNENVKKDLSNLSDEEETHF